MTIFVGILAVSFGILVIVFRKSIPGIIYALLVMMYDRERAELFSNPRIDPWVLLFVGCGAVLLGTSLAISAL